MHEEDYLSHTEFAGLDFELLTNEQIHRLAVELYNRGYYFETHEVWEEIWQVDQTDSRNFYQGLIQLAAALVHAQNNNPGGMFRMKDMAIEKLLPYPEEYQGVLLKKLIEDSTDFHSKAKDDEQFRLRAERPKIAGPVLDWPLPKSPS